MTEHEKLKRICDEIGFNYEGFGLEYFDKNFFNSDEIGINAIEIIFTPSFMDKFVKYYDNKKLLGHKRIYESLGIDLLMSNLHDPVTYLYNLLFNK